jgi:hypothetical protein
VAVAQTRCAFDVIPAPKGQEFLLLAHNVLCGQCSERR